MKNQKPSLNIRALLRKRASLTVIIKPRIARAVARPGILQATARAGPIK